MVKPKKSLGQHFLRDLNAAQRIVDAVEPLAPVLLMEIGPGEGVLTERLLPKYPELHIIEIDDESVAHLRKEYFLNPDRLHHVDFLKWPIPEGQWVIIGNFPYNISSQIVFKMLENREIVRGLVGMFQKEVAQRIASPPGSKDYGILSVLCQTFYDVEYLFTVEADAFFPPPKVQSGVIRVVRKKGYKPDCDERFLFTLVKQAFNQRRKMLRNSIKSFLNDSNQDAVSQYLEMRPEQLGFEDFVKLSRLLKP
ncbi:MAG: 16S rRNA (adenine(1518)-N(6)/adenine(1519)-N(6))-dimethyltransferase RsmA [Flavobacteriales bacterium]